jgi:pimeloyl-ACP methyl ester carboxylesterase
MKAGIAEVNGTRLYYELEGEGDAIALVNPGALDCRIWAPQWDAFTKTHRVLRYDPRGWGRSAPAAGPFSHLDDLDRLMDAAGMEKAHLLGSSFGGSVALDFAVVSRKRVSSLILVGAGGPQNGFPMPGELLLAFAPVGQVMREDFARGIDLWLETDARMPRSKELRELVRENALANESYWKIPFPSIANLTPPVAERLGEIDAPTLVLVGANDHPYAHEIAEALARGIRGAARLVIEDAGHLAHLDRAEEFNRIVSDFIAASRSRAH